MALPPRKVAGHRIDSNQEEHKGSHHVRKRAAETRIRCADDPDDRDRNRLVGGPLTHG